MSKASAEKVGAVVEKLCETMADARKDEKAARRAARKLSRLLWRYRAKRFAGWDTSWFGFGKTYSMGDGVVRPTIKELVKIGERFDELAGEELGKATEHAQDAKVARSTLEDAVRRIT